LKPSLIHSDQIEEDLFVGLSNDVHPDLRQVSGIFEKG
jgi:hypothetical protein